MPSTRRSLRPLRRALSLAVAALVATLALVACDALNPPARPQGAEEGPRLARPLPDLPPDAVEDEKASVQHLLIQYQGATRAPSTLLRSRDQARTLAEELAGQAAAEGADFDALVRANSEEPNAAETGGIIGAFRRGEMVPPFEEAAFKLKVGELSGVVETVFGFHVLKRLPVEEIRASHILIQYEGARNARPSVSRTKEQAQELAAQVRQMAVEPGSDFVDLARQYSDCPSAPAGGDLGQFGRGVMVPAFEQAAFSTSVEGVSGVVETPFGFHIIRRSG